MNHIYFIQARINPLCTLGVVWSAFTLSVQTYSKTCVKWPLSKRLKIGFHDQFSLNAGQKYCWMLQGEHSAILMTFIKLPFVILSIFEWPFCTGFTGFAQAWKYLNIQDCLEKSLKINLPWKVLEKHSKALKSPWILLFTGGFNSVFGVLNQYNCGAFIWYSICCTK